MNILQFSSSFYLILAVSLMLFMALGYLVATFRYKQKMALLSTELLSTQQRLADIQNQSSLWQAELKQQQQTLQQTALTESKLQEKYYFAQTTNQRLERELQDSKADNRQLQQELTTLSNHYTKLKTELDERDASHQREVASFEKQKNSLVEQFKALSAEILDAKAQSLQETSKVSLHAMLSPFQQSMDAFKKEVQDIHHRETTAQGELKKELESLKALNQQITLEAHELSTALRGQKKLQGNWGELVLENILDRSGLQLGKDYQREVSFTTEEGKFRPDAIVYLPQNKHLVIDAKVSLNAYTRYVNAQSELESQQALKEHVQAIGSRIKELSAKDYFKLPGLNSPDMVFMYIHNE